MLNSSFMRLTTKKRAAAQIWRQFSPTVEQLNYNAKLVRWINSQNVPGFKNRFELYEFLNRELGQITYLEFGVWKGESLRRWAEINSHPKSRFFGFDSFEGLPETWHHGMGRTTGTERFSLHSQVPQFSDQRITPIKGWFQDTLPAFLSHFSAQGPLIINNDSDLYSSTLYTLAKLDGIFKTGDIIIFDEFTSPANEFRAWSEYLNAFMRKAECVAMSFNWCQAAFRFA